MNSSSMTQRMDNIIQQIIRNRFEASVKGTSTEAPYRLVSLTRDMGYNDLANELAGKLKRLEPMEEFHL